MLPHQNKSFCQGRCQEHVGRCRCRRQSRSGWRHGGGGRQVRTNWQQQRTQKVSAQLLMIACCPRPVSHLSLCLTPTSHWLRPPTNIYKLIRIAVPPRSLTCNPFPGFYISSGSSLIFMRPIRKDQRTKGRLG